MIPPLLIIAGIVAALLAVFIGLYDRLALARNAVRAAWMQIDVQLKRRHELIPALIEAVRGAMKQERELMETIMRTRQSAQGGIGLKAQAAAEGEVGRLLARLLASARKADDVRTNPKFAAIESELADIETRLADAQRVYNDAAKRYNAACEGFPSGLVATVACFQTIDLFETGEAGAA